MSWPGILACGEAAPSEGRSRVKHYVWDWVVRLCHLVFVVGCVAAYVTYQMGAMDWHAWCGYAVLAALAVRIVWGVIGSPHARFTSFVRGPKAVRRYVSTWMRQPAPLGHNPLGGYATIALMLALLVQTVTGLFSDDEIATTGPLRSWVSDDMAQSLTHIHRLSFYVLLALVALHLTAITVYALVKRINLVGPMITGWKKD
jgi:cytochrome b